MELNHELRKLELGDRTIEEYFARIKGIADLTDSLGSTVSDEDIVTYTVNGLGERFDQVAGIISYRDPFPDLDIVHSMLLVEEKHLNRKTRNQSELHTKLLARSLSTAKVKGVAFLKLKGSLILYTGACNACWVDEMDRRHNQKETCVHP
ncbi:hypothetical protein Tco_0698790 [Tanacetum coccineum]